MLHRFLRQNKYGRLLLREVAALADDELWDVFASANENIRGMSHGPRVLTALKDWAVNGHSGPLSTTQSNITSLPLLSVLQIGQYLRYLDVHSLSHQDFVSDIREGGGGVHGYCGGLPAAICISCARTQDELVKYMGAALRILVGIGAYTEATDENSGTESTILAIRLKYEGQGEELTRRFPGTYISAITGPRSISVGGPAATLGAFAAYVAGHEGVRSQEIQLGGSAHNPANAHLAAELCRICHDDTSQRLQLPHASQLLLPLRSNQTGERITDGLLADDLIWTMLASRCEWLQLLKAVAQDLTQSPRTEHCFVAFGWDDCITMSPFVQAHLQVTKVFAKSLIMETSEPPRPSIQQLPSDDGGDSGYEFPKNAIAITGAACRLPGANSMDELWELLASGRNCVQELPRNRFKASENYRILTSASSQWKNRKFYGNFIEDVKRFDNAFFGISAREAANVDPQQRIMLELSFEALEDAGYLASHRREAGDDVGCFIGLVLGEYVENTNAHPPTAYTSTGTVPAFVCGRLSHTYGWSGPSEMFNTACSSSMVAINRACKAIQAGECRMALAGGANVMTGINTYLDLAKAGFLSPTGQCKPFNAAADGYCRADGCGVVVLKRLKDAVADGDPIWGVIAGVATNQGGLSASLTVPDATAQQSLYKKVLGQAGLTGSQVTYVEAHGTGTQVGDPIEMSSIRSVFGGTSRQTKVAVGSIKGNIGHAEPAAGVAGLLKVLAMLRHGKIPPQASYGTLNPNIPPLERDGMEIATRLRGWNTPFRAALVNSYGAGGSNAALLVCGAPRLRLQNDAVSEESRVLKRPSPLVSCPFLVTAASTASLLETAKSLGLYLGSIPKDGSFVDIAYTLSHRKQRQKCQAVFKASTAQEAARLLRSMSSTDTVQVPADAGVSPRPVVLAFSGQSDRMIALPKSLYDDFPAFRFHLDACEAEFLKHAENSLLEAVFQTEAVEDIAALQCGMFAVQHACAQCWISAGVKPQAVVGHSLGEYTAMAVSGILSLADSIRLIYSRARLVESQWGPDKGSMLAVECTADDSGQLSPEMLGLETACFNGPRSVVMAGREDAIEEAEELLKKNATFRFQRLRTTNAFHSALADPILSELEALDHSCKRNTPAIPFYACSPDGSEPLGQNAANHARQPVYFDHAVQRIETALGGCIWLEAGFDTTIVTMAKRCCRRSGRHTFQPVKTKGLHRPSDAIADTVTNLWSYGLNSIKHWSFLPKSEDSPEPCHPVWLPPYQFAKPSHWLDNIDRAGEMHTKLQQANLDTEPPPQITAPPLVSRRSTSSDRAGCASFVINTQHPRYRSVVEGHVVCSRPLCPAPMYMECATMALMLMKGDGMHITSKALKFEDFNVRSPLGIDPQGAVVLRLEAVPETSHAWRVKVLSIYSSPNSLKGDSASSETIHLEATISLDAEAQLDSYQRLVSRGIQTLVHSSTSENLHGSRAYKMFSRVVKYGDFFKGLKSVQVDGSEVLATVQAPSDQPHRLENQWCTVCDAVILDMSIHALGLLINTSDHVSDGEVAVMMGLDRAVITQDFVMDTTTTPLALMGLDSLGSAELSDGLLSKFGISIPTADLLNSTAADLERLLVADVSVSQALEPNLLGDRAQQPQAASNSHGDDLQTERFFQILSDACGADHENIPLDATLVHLGVDSLALIDMKQEIEDHFSVILDLKMEDSIKDIMKSLGMGVVSQQPPLNEPDPLTELSPVRSGLSPASLFESNPFQLLEELSPDFDAAAGKHGVIGYWSTLAPLQDQIAVAYIVEALSTLGVDLRNVTTKRAVPVIQYLSPKYDKLMRRIWEILQKHGIVSLTGTQEASANIVRGSAAIETRSASELLREFSTRFPAYVHETTLIELTGPQLANCLSGKTDSVSLMFGNPTSLQIMENYYAAARRPVRILEVGGGTGGTTRYLVEALAKAGIATDYTFTDISPSLVKNAKNKFSHLPWIRYSTLNLESEIRPEFLGRFDLVVATNVVHATKDRTASCRRICSTLTSAGGLFVLAETTSKIDWCDICFGLLDGWWFADGPIAPLQTAPEWAKTLRDAGFASTGYSHGSSADTNTTQLIIGSNTKWDAGPEPTFCDTSSDPLPVRYCAQKASDDKEQGHRMETVGYKEVDGVQIKADVYYPRAPMKSPRPVALMIHGGGYVTLSRRAIRLEQTRYLLKMGLLPVSIDYRLCPEVNIIDGPMTDVCDAYRWVRQALPAIALGAGVRVDPSRVVVVGWSTGGQLAMSLGWTAPAAGLPPPNAALSFYAPVDFESGGDPRSDLLMIMYQDRIALPVLLNGISYDNDDATSTSKGSSRSLSLVTPSPDRIAAISPLARLRAGRYDVPTFIIHGREDEVAPFAAAESLGYIPPTPCIGQFRFLNLTLYKQPSYQAMLERLKAGEARYLEIGFGLGQDIRKLVADGAPGQHVFGTELEAGFVDLSYELWRDRTTLQAQLTQSDALADLNGDGDGGMLSRLKGTVDYLYLGMVLHVFDRERQLALLENCVRLLKSAGPQEQQQQHGAMILGEAVGDIEGCTAPAGNFMHSDATLRQLLAEVSERTGRRFDCRVTLDEGLAMPDAQNKWGQVRARRLVFEVEMLYT
ncbi:BcPKS16- polyketide synthase [Apiospora aurea]|uniref:BcPKS16- polyketide synthase n=1 Tax=Apiospora aurea TaxID=335848 RepID=A0ABR1QK53_9PEZI